MAAEAREPSWYFEREMAAPEEQRFLSGEVAVFSARSPAKARPGGDGAAGAGNEDAAALLPVSPRRGVLAVADGVGGLPAGERASSRALVELGRSLASAGRRRTRNALRDAILDGIEAANRAVLGLGGGATTMVVAELRGRRVRSYHVGDSVLLVCGRGGEVKRRTVQHSPVGYMVESGLLDDWAAMDHEDLHFIDNVVGSAEMRIEVGPALELEDGDTLVLATDGLVDNLHPLEVARLFGEGSLAEAAARVAEACGRRMLGLEEGQPSKPDDLAFVAYRCRG